MIWFTVCLISHHHLKRSQKRSRNGRSLRRTNRFRYMLIDESENVEMTTSLKANQELRHSDSLSSDDKSDVLLDYQLKSKRKNKPVYS